MEMSRKQFVLLLRQHFGKSHVIEHAPRRVEIHVERDELEAVCRWLKTEENARLMTMVGTDERPLGAAFALYYVYGVDRYQTVVTVSVSIGEDDPTFPSMAAEFPALNWYEREVNDLLGLRAVGHPDRSPLVLKAGWPTGEYPLRKDYDREKTQVIEDVPEEVLEYEGNEVVEVPVGPIHAGIIEPGHFRFGVLGDNVLHLDARLFYTHRGVEKMTEGMTLEQGILAAERTCGVCALSHALAYAHAVEDAGHVIVPKRARFLRTIFGELERIYNHVGDVGNICAGFGFAVGINHGSRLKEKLLMLNEEMTGSRYLRGIVRVGGMRRDWTNEELERIVTVLNEVEAEFDEITEILLSHEIAVNRMATTGILPLDKAEALEVVGVGGRASGRRTDSRIGQPYDAYAELPPQLITDEHGDVMARITVRVSEAKEAMKLIREAVLKLPAGDIYAPVGNIAAGTFGIGWSESARGENCHFVMVGAENTVYRYRIRSAAYSNWPAVALAVPGNIVPDFPLINKSFELCYACCDR